MINVLYLTYNPSLGSSTRTLQSWILRAPAAELAPSVCVREDGHLVRWLAHHEVPYRIHPMPWPDKRRPLSTLQEVSRLARWCRELRVDLVHCEHDAHPFGALLGRMLRCPVVCHMHFRVSRPFCEWAFGGWRRPDALIWTSQSQCDDCAEAVAGLVGADRQFVIPLGVDPREFGALAAGREGTRRAWGVDRGTVVIGTAAALRPRKRIGDFVEVVRRVAATVPDVVGVLAGDARPGDEGYRAEILAQVAGSGLGPRFRWLGKLEPIEPFYHAIDVLVSTSEYETFGMSVCEAMACNRPVVAYRGGSVKEVVGDAGVIVETGDVLGMAEAVEQLARHPEGREELGEAARDRVDQWFNPDRSLPRLRAIYEAILAQARARRWKRGLATVVRAGSR